jgi:hypothetical protein
VVIDFQKKILPIGPPSSMKLSEKEVIAEFQNAGFKLSRRLNIPPYQYFLIFENRIASCAPFPNTTSLLDGHRANGQTGSVRGGDGRYFFSNSGTCFFAFSTFGIATS